MNRLFAVCGWVLPLGLYLAATSPAASGQATSDTTPRSFIKFMLPDGSEGRLPPNTVIRIRKTISTENKNGAKASIDGLQMMLVRELPAEVAARLEESHFTWQIGFAGWLASLVQRWGSARPHAPAS